MAIASRRLGTAQLVLMVVGFIGLLSFSIWIFALAQDVLQLREELALRDSWVEAGDELSARLAAKDAESMRLVAARGLDLLNEMRVRPSVNGRSGELIADTSTILVELQKAKKITPEMVTAMRQGLDEILAVVLLDQVRLSNRLRERWNAVFILVVGALALCVGLFSLLLLFLRSSQRLERARARMALGTWPGT